MRTQRISFVAIVALGAAGLVAISAPAAHSAPPPAGAYQPLSLSRILDTRVGTGAPKKAVAAQATVALKVAGVGGVPASGAGTALLTIRVTESVRSGAITAYAAGASRPSTVSVFYSAGQTIADTVPVKIGTGGVVNIFNNSDGATHLIADVIGYYTAGTGTAPGTYTSLPPTGLINSTTGLGVPKAPLGPNSTTIVAAAGHGAVPSTGVGAVALQVAVTKATATGSLTAYATGTSRPGGTSLDYSAAQTRSQFVLAPLDASGHFTLFNSSTGVVTVYADVIGYVAGGAPASAGTYRAVPATRIINTSIAAGTSAGAPLPDDVPFPPIDDRFGTTTGSPISAVVVKIGANPVSSTGTLTVYPNSIFRPANSNVTLTAGQAGGNTIVLPVTNGFVSGNNDPVQITVYNGSTAATTVTADIVGYYLTVGSSVTGIVTDATGHPLSGVLVSADADPFDNDGIKVTTGVDGTYLIPGLTPAVNAHTVCFDPSTATGGTSTTGYLVQCYNGQSTIFSANQFTTVDGTATVINAQLVAAATVSGKVTDSLGHGLKNVSVSLNSQGNAAPLDADAVTDAAGNWSVSGLNPSTQVVACFDPHDSFTGNPDHGGSFDSTGYLPSCYSNRPVGQGTVFAVASGVTSGINQSLAAGGAISGVVTFANASVCAGGCLAGVVAGSSPTDPPIALAGINSTNGVYKIYGVKPGSVHVYFGADGGTRFFYPNAVSVVSGQTTTGINGSVG